MPQRCLVVLMTNVALSGWRQGVGGTVDGSRILVVDDDRRLLRILEFYLTMEGFEMAAVADGDAALRLLAKENFDLVIIDVMTPGCDGIELCRRVQTDPRTHPVPTLLVTTLLTARCQPTGLVT